MEMHCLCGFAVCVVPSDVLSDVPLWVLVHVPQTVRALLPAAMHGNAPFR